MSRLRTEPALFDDEADFEAGEDTGAVSSSSGGAAPVFGGVLLDLPSPRSRLKSLLSRL